MKRLLLALLLIGATVQSFAQMLYVNEDFNNSTLPTGWTNNAVSGTEVWKFGIDGWHNNPNVNYNLDGTPFAFFDDDALGASSINNTVELITPTFDNSNNSITTLDFDYNFRQAPGAVNDSFAVFIDTGSGWTNIFTVKRDDCGNFASAICMGNFPHARIDISQYRSTNTRVKFLYHDGNDWGYHVGIDNVVIQSPVNYDIGVSRIITPTSGCGLTDQEGILVEVINRGLQDVSSYDIAFSINGGTPVVETINNTLNSFDTTTYLFNSTADLSVINIHTVQVYTILTNDAQPHNDTATYQIENEPSHALTYAEDFENGNGGWKVGGTNSSWQRGVPSAPSLNSAPSGQNIFTTNLIGNYNANERSYLISPCFDFSQTIGDPIMSFWLYYQTEVGFDNAWMEYSTDNGNTWRKLQAGGVRPTNWYNNIQNNVWEGFSNQWLRVENVLVGLGGEPQVKFRFTFNSDGGTHYNGIGVDLFTIREPQPVDLSLNEVLYPVDNSSPLCGYGPAENVILELENKGALPIDTFYVFYQVDNGSIVSDSIYSRFSPNSTLRYTFDDKYNFSSIRNYILDVWVETPRDSFPNNDTISNLRISNSQTVNTETISYYQSFDNFTNPNQQNWRAVPSTGTYQWRTANQSNSTTSGPARDHTTGQGVFVFADAQASGSAVATFESPCFDLSNNTGAVLEFYYHRYTSTPSNMGPLYVDVYDGKDWIEVSEITKIHPSSTSDWDLHTVNLNTYAGRRLKIRFRSKNIGQLGKMAIDDVILYEPVANDVRSLGAFYPISGCMVNNASEIRMRLQNLGSLPVEPADSLYVGYQVNDGPIVEEYVGYNINPEEVREYSFLTTADLSHPGRTYNIKTWVRLPTDKVPFNDTNFLYRIINHTIVNDQRETFETSRDANCNGFLGQVIENGWVAEPGNYAWHVQNTVECKGETATPTPNTGPYGDNTTGRGNFLYTQGTGSTNSPPAILLSPCLDLTSRTKVNLSFWYHRYGDQMGDLVVQVKDSMDAWVDVLKLEGEDQKAPTDAWKNATVRLDNFTGNFSQIRFVGYYGGARGNMAIDDIDIFNRIDQDAGVVEIIEPAFENNCNLSSSATVKVLVKNFGSLPIAANSMTVHYSNNHEQHAQQVVPVSIDPDSVYELTFTQNIDLSGTGTQNIRVWTQLNGDTHTTNDLIEKNIINRSLGFPYYTQDFEYFQMGAGGYAGDDLQGWTRTPNGSGHSWHVWQGPAPTIDGEPMPNPPIVPNGPSGDHTFATDFKNGNGMYMLVETKFRRGGHADAIFTTPCGGIDFTESKSGRILLSFYYHMFGNVGDLFVDVHNGNQWVQGVTSIRGDQQDKATDPWKEHQVSLNNFSHVTNGRIRFRAQFRGQVGGGDIGLDDISLLDQDTIDMATKQLLRPTSDCNTRNQEQVEVIVQNVGFSEIHKVKMAYQVTWFPLNGDPVVRPIQRDSAIATVVQNARYTFRFNPRADMSQPGNYQFKIWSEVTGDRYEFNDTLIQIVTNKARPFPYCEDFSELLFGDIPKDFEDETMTNWWKGNQSDYAFKAAIEGGGPVAGVTTGLNDIYLFADDGDGNPQDEAWIETTCFDLTSTKAANLEFYYMAPSKRHYMLIEARAAGGGAWKDLDTLYANYDTLQGDPVTSWTKVSLSLAEYVGDFVEFRITAINAGDGFYAIDNFCIVRPLPQQMDLVTIVSPSPGRCYYSANEPVRLRVRNTGIDRIDSFRVVFAIDSGFVQFPPGGLGRDTFWIYPTTPTFEPGDVWDFYLDSTYFMEDKKEYFLNVHIYLPGDMDTVGNIIENYRIEHQIPIDIPYIIDFEDPNDPLEGLLYGQTGMFYTGGVYRGMSRPNVSGPADDHTFQNGTGHYFRTNSALGDAGDAVVLQSMCIDLTQAVQPELQYWYHMFGYNMGQLDVEANDDSGWRRVDSLAGEDPDQINNGRPWKMRSVQLNNPQAGWNYAGKFVRLRFVSYRGGDASDMGIDDIFVFDRASKDLTPHALAAPNDGVYSCYSDTQEVKVEIRNNGSEDIDFTVDVTEITVEVKKNGVPWDTLRTTVNTNQFIKNGIPPAVPLPRDSTVIIKLDGTFDMSDIGAMFDFRIYTDMVTEVLRRNDTIEEGVLAQREAGSITLIQPDETICYQTPVRLNIRDFFGRLQWQEKEHDSQGDGFWINGFSFPSDSPQYVVILDTTTELKVKICDVIETVPVKINITKPYSGKALDNSRCGPGAIRSAIEFPYYGPTATNNIDSVFVYSNINANNYDTLSSGEPIVEDGKLIYYIEYDNLLSDDTVYVSTKTDSCWSPLRTEVITKINPYPVVQLADTNYKEVCQDTTLILNAGAMEGHTFKYDWTIIEPDGTIIKDSTQTIVVDAWKLELNKIYKYTVYVESDYGCNVDQTGPNDTLYVRITDSCVTSVRNHEFGDEFNIYPNPTNDELFIEYRSFTDLVGTIKLLSMDGKLIEQHENVNFRMQTTKFDMGRHARGIYFIKIETNSGVIVRKIIKS